MLSDCRRFKAVIATPLVFSSVFSNMFFFGGYEVGVYFINQVFVRKFKENFRSFKF